jgi:hypothetical protein
MVVDDSQNGIWAFSSSTIDLIPGRCVLSEARNGVLRYDNASSTFVGHNDSKINSFYVCVPQR